jgi:hypothetical protein
MALLTRHSVPVLITVVHVPGYRHYGIPQILFGKNQVLIQDFTAFEFDTLCHHRRRRGAGKEPYPGPEEA